MSDKQPRTFQIEHSQVGPYTKGSVVSDAHLAQHNADIDHLIRNGAITETNLPASGEPVLNADEMLRQKQERIAAAAMNNKGTDTFTGDDMRTMARTPVVDESSTDEPTYGSGKHPLSYFDGKTDEQILEEPGIGDAKLHEIKAAQKKAAKGK